MIKQLWSIMSTILVICGNYSHSNSPIVDTICWHSNSLKKKWMPTRCIQYKFQCQHNRSQFWNSWEHLSYCMLMEKKNSGKTSKTPQKPIGIVSQHRVRTFSIEKTDLAVPEPCERPSPKILTRWFAFQNEIDIYIWEFHQWISEFHQVSFFDKKRLYSMPGYHTDLFLWSFRSFPGVFFSH